MTRDRRYRPRTICPDCGRNVAGVTGDGHLRVGYHKRGHGLCGGSHALVPEPTTARRPYGTNRSGAPPRPAGLPSALRGCP